MELISSKTVRFAKVVEACGAPQVVTLWMDPKKDKKLSAAIKANRIMTVIRETVGTKKEFGLVGLHQRPAAIFLLFPKSLSAYANNRVVGIKYDLVGESYVSDPISLKKQSAASGKVQKQPQARAKPTPSRKEAAKAAPVEKTYDVSLRATAAVTSTVKVTALNATRARREAIESYTPDTAHIQWRKSVTKVREQKNQP